MRSSWYSVHPERKADQFITTARMLQVFLVSRSPGLHTNKPCYTLNKQTYTMLRNNKDIMSLGTAKGHLVNVTVLKRDNPKMQSPKLGDYSNFPTFHQ